MNELSPIISYKILSSNFDDPEGSVYEINGKVFVYDEKENKKIVAKCRHFFIDLENSESHVFDLLDMQAETAPFIELYESEGSALSYDVLEAVGDEVWNENLLILDRIEVLPRYRGNGLARTIIEDAIKVFSSRTDIAALKVFPLQLESAASQSSQSKWAKSMGLQELDQDEERAKKHLESFYVELGFKVVGSQSLMVRKIS